MSENIKKGEMTKEETLKINQEEAKTFVNNLKG